MPENSPQPDDVPADLIAEQEAAGAAAQARDEAPPEPEASPPETGSAGEPDAAQLEIESLRRERDELRDRWLRAVAELDNFRKRTRKELEDVRVLAVANLLRDLLEILDNFERATIAMREANGQAGDLDNWRDGVALIHQRFRDILMAQGLERIEAVGADFDPNLHEAILQVEADGVAPGQIAEIVQAGYRLRDLVIRPCRVIVAK